MALPSVKPTAIAALSSRGILRAREIEGDRTHTEIQGWLRDMGRALGYAVWIAANDRGRSCDDGLLSDGCLAALPEAMSRQPRRSRCG